MEGQTAEEAARQRAERAKSHYSYHHGKLVDFPDMWGCPFCGSLDFIWHGTAKNHIVVRHKPGCFLSTVSKITVIEVPSKQFDAWNERVVETQADLDDAPVQGEPVKANEVKPTESEATDESSK